MPSPGKPRSRPTWNFLTCPPPWIGSRDGPPGPRAGCNTYNLLALTRLYLDRVNLYMRGHTCSMRYRTPGWHGPNSLARQIAPGFASLVGPFVGRADKDAKGSHDPDAPASALR